MTNRSNRAVYLIAVAALLTACDGGGGDACVAGSTQICDCAPSVQGVQTCDALGGFGACRCEGFDGGPSPIDGGPSPTDGGGSTDGGTTMEDGGIGMVDPCPGPSVWPMPWNERVHAPWVSPDGTLYGIGVASILRYCTDVPDELPGMGTTDTSLDGREPIVNLSDGGVAFRVRDEVAVLNREASVEVVFPLATGGTSGLQVDASDTFWIVAGDEASACDRRLVAYDRAGTEVADLRLPELCSGSRAAAQVQVAAGVPYAVLGLSDLGYDIRRIDLSNPTAPLVPVFLIPETPDPSGASQLRIPLLNGQGDLIRFWFKHTVDPTTPGISTVTHTLEHWDPATGSIVSTFSAVTSTGVISAIGPGQYVEGSEQIYSVYNSTDPDFYGVDSSTNRFLLVFDRATGVRSRPIPELSREAAFAVHPDGSAVAAVGRGSLHRL